MPFKDLKARLLGLKKKDKPQQTEQAEPASADETQSATSSAAATPKAEISFEDGVIALHPNLNAIVDICFVHGLTGNRESTWTADGQSRPWPETMLSKFLDKARIITYGYDAYVVRGVTKVASGNRLIDHATNFLNDLSTDRAIENASSRPIIFVAHSLGGLVCKEALLLSRNNPEPHLKSLFTSTKAVAFMGTPHTGSWMADWSTILATALGIVKSTNKSLLEILETDDQFLESIQVGFLSMIRGLQREGRQLEITCFYEELPLPVIGRKVVSKDSATFAGYNPISIHANHRNMVKFASEYENGFKRLLGELVRWQSEISAATTTSHQMAGGRSNVPRTVMLKPQQPSSEEPSSVKSDGSSHSSASSENNERKSMHHRMRNATKLFKLINNAQTSSIVAACIEALDLDDRFDELARLNQQNRVASKAKRSQVKFDIRQVYQAATKRCLKALSFPEMGQRQSIIEQPAPDTCQWIYTNDKYCAWRSSSNKLLWIKGKPGSGKSILMKSLDTGRRRAAPRKSKGIKQAEDPEANTIFLSFFFNARGAMMEKSPIGLYVTLLHELLSQDAVAMCEFLPTFLRKESLTSTGKVTWHVSELGQHFHSLIETKRPYCVEILIDALDECQDEEVRAMVRNFEKSVNATVILGTHLKICWSSRYYPHISLQSNHGISLSLDKENDQDISLYIREELPDQANSALRSVRQEIMSKAQGVFLWAVLVVHKLRKASDEGNDEDCLREQLSSIPDKLDDLFNQIFRSSDFNHDRVEDLIRILAWVLCSFRPLSLHDLQTALSIRKSQGSWSFEEFRPSRQDGEQLERRTVTVSGGLIEVTQGVVQVVHESVREFFLGKQGLAFLNFPSKEAFIEAAHKEIALTCFQALLSRELNYPTTSAPHIQHAKSSVVDMIEALTQPLSSVDDTFLKHYVQDFVFEHFYMARNLFTNHGKSDVSLVESSTARRPVLINFLRLHCLQMREERGFRPGANAHLQRVSMEPEVWGVLKPELLELVTFTNNLYAASTYFAGRGMFMFEEEFQAGFPRRKSADFEFFAGFFIYAETRRTSKSAKMPNIRSKISSYSSNLTELLNSKREKTYYNNNHDLLHPVFAMSFRTNCGDLTAHQYHNRDDVLSTRWPLLLWDWSISRDVSAFAWPEEYQHLFREETRNRIHEHSRPIVLCFLFRKPWNFAMDSVGDEYESDEMPQRSQRSQGLPDTNQIFEFVEYGEMELPKRVWWRPHPTGRSREIFEHDSDTESDILKASSRSSSSVGLDRSPGSDSQPPSLIDEAEKRVIEYFVPLGAQT